ncbi:L-asparagine permease 2 [Salmonella enterica subsp. enterica serovar Napoli]|nr:L-asparagine permease 2 [Salmonella enterica subsp. enterica serovar Napoli]
MKTQTTHAAEQHAAKRRWLNAHEEGYHKAMGNRQVQMIAIGGAIGTGLFLGAGARLQMAGPALALVYLICGIFLFHFTRAGRTGIAPPFQRELRLLRPRVFG